MDGKHVILLGGEKRVLSFNNFCLIYLGQVLNCDPLETDQNITVLAAANPMRALAFITYSALMGEYEAQANYTHDVQLKDVTRWVGEANVEEITSVWEAFKGIYNIPSATEEQVKEYASTLDEKKKKSRSKSSLNTP